jgi:hypothetical protein
MKKVILFTSFCFLAVLTLNAQKNDKISIGEYKKFCYKTATSKYELTLEEGSDNKTFYMLYNSSGDVVKTMQGYWEIRDEGVYGSLFVLIIKWSGLNDNLPNLKYTCQYNSNRQLQQLIDSQKRNWYPCD